jgi:hypothetical protein
MDPPSSPRWTLYFAFGSNLHLQQMAKRCPESLYVGRARLPGFRWQINERGFANIVESREDVVEGLVYALSEKDEARLDRNEGVSRDLYHKSYNTIELIPAPYSLRHRRVSTIVAEGGPEGILQSTVREEVTPKLERALVYISLFYVKEGPPRREYIDRMNLGLEDALVLGVSRSYISALRVRIHKMPPLDHQNHQLVTNERGTPERISPGVGGQSLSAASPRREPSSQPNRPMKEGRRGRPEKVPLDYSRPQKEKVKEYQEKGRGSLYGNFPRSSSYRPSKLEQDLKMRIESPPPRRRKRSSSDSLGGRRRVLVIDTITRILS